MADLFASSYADWLPPFDPEDGDRTPDLECHDGRIKSSRPLDYQGIGNVFHAGHHPSAALSDVDYKSPLIHTSTYPTDRSAGDTSRSDFDTSFLASPNQDFDLEWCRERGDIFRDMDFTTTQRGKFTEYDFKSFDTDMELRHHHTEDITQSNIVPTYRSTQELSQPTLYTLSNVMTHSSPIHPPSVSSNVCTVHPTPNPRIFVFRCTFPRCHAKTFGRWFDFHRHYNGAHASEKTVFWCPVGECSRSEGGGNRGFPRKDKMMVHVEKMHRGDEGQGDERLE